MAETKYEIKSEEMSSLLKKIPHSLITKGNLLVLIILIIFFYLLNRYAPTDQLKLEAHVDRLIIHDKNKNLIHFSLIVKKMEDSMDSFQSNFEYRFEDGRSTDRHVVLGIIDSITFRNTSTIVLFVTSNSTTSLTEHSNGYLIIDRKEKTFFSRILSSIFNL